MVSRVRATPGIPEGVTVSGELDMHQPGQHHIDVELEDGTRVVRDRLDAWHFTLKHYAGTKSEAMKTALLVREYLIEQVPGKAYGNVGVDHIKDEGIHDQGDKDSREQCIIHRVTIYIYEV